MLKIIKDIYVALSSYLTTVRRAIALLRETGYRGLLPQLSLCLLKW